MKSVLFQISVRIIVGTLLTLLILAANGCAHQIIKMPDGTTIESKTMLKSIGWIQWPTEHGDIIIEDSKSELSQALDLVDKVK